MNTPDECLKKIKHIVLQENNQQIVEEFITIHSKSTFIAATNLEEELDTAVWRRFDTRMTYGLPGKAELDMFLTKLLGDSQENKKLIEQSKELLQGCSFADIEQIILKAKRKMIIEDSEMSYDKIAHGYVAYNPRTLPREAAPAGAI